MGGLGEQWASMRGLLRDITLSEEPDKLVWTLTNSGIFSVKSFYNAMQSHRVVPYKFLWKIKLPMKIKTFIWLVLKRSILTRDVLKHRGGDCEETCLFCGKNESINHLFFECPLARYIWNVVGCAFGTGFQFTSAEHAISVWLKGKNKKQRGLWTVGVAATLWGIWKTRNAACFEKWPDEPCDVVFRISYWIQWWSLLQVKQCAKDRLAYFARLLEKVAKEIFGARRIWTPWIPRLTM